MGGIEAAAAAAAEASMGTLWTDLMEPLGAIRNCGGAMGDIALCIPCIPFMGPISCGWMG